jgi:adenosylmethionine-8-amino-7-oxononanoate aminotransferase
LATTRARFVVQAGHGRRDLAGVAAKQAAELAYFPVCGYATPPASELAERIAHLAPGDLNRVFFTSGGGEAVESAAHPGRLPRAEHQHLSAP